MITSTECPAYWNHSITLEWQTRSSASTSKMAIFGFHLDDGDLCSINYLHRGKPKIWYFVPAEEGVKLEQLIQRLFPQSGCDRFIRHKQVLIPPSVLTANGIRFTRVRKLPKKPQKSKQNQINCRFQEEVSPLTPHNLLFSLHFPKIRQIQDRHQCFFKL